MKKYVSLGIMMTLYNGKRVTAPELAEKYETSVKTIYRAIDNLLEAGMPIRCISGKGGGYEIIKESKINSSFFTLTELSSFISFLKATKGSVINESSSTIDERIESLADKKIKENLVSESNALVIDTDNWGSSSQNSLLSEQIKQAISKNQKVEIEYSSRNDCVVKRVIHPYTIVYKAGVWYVYSYCENRSAFRLFKLSRIKTLNVLNQRFERQNIDSLSKPWNKEFEENLETIEMCLIAKNCVMPEIMEWLGNEDVLYNQICNHNNNNNLNYYSIKTNVNFSLGLIHRLMQFGNNVEILSPKKLQDAIKNECYNIYQTYIN